MTDFVFGAPASASTPTPEPAPENPRTEPAEEAVREVPQEPAVKGAPEAPRVSQAQLLEQRADELEALFHRLPQAGDAPAPGSENRQPTRGKDHVVERWKRLLSDPDAARAAGLPAGSRAWLETPPGAMVVRVQVPHGYARNTVARTLKAHVEGMAWGEHKTAPCTLTGDNGEEQFYLIRRHAGGDLATPFRVASTTAEKFRSGADRMRERVLHTAGLSVDRPVIRGGRHALDDAGKPMYKRIVPELMNAGEWDRGVEFVLKMCPGQGITDFEKAAEKLSSMFRRPVTVEARDRDLVAIRLTTKDAAELPKSVVLKPSMLYLPRSAEQAVKISKKLVIPVGLTRTPDGQIERVDVRPAAAPHGLIVGSPGTGKSRYVRSLASGWAVQGGWLIILDPKLGELVDGWLPGTVCIATSVATISRTLLWARTEMLTRLAVQDVLKKRGVSPAPFQPILILADEWGQMLTELKTSTDPAEKAAGEELERVVVKTLQVGRSVGIHLVLISQNALTSSISGPIAQAAAWRIITGRPQGGASGSGMVDRLFPITMRDEARVLGDTIPAETPGYALLDFKNRPVVARTFYGYSPGEEPEDPRFADLPAEIVQSWRDMRTALQSAPPVRRFGWRPGPDTPADWQALSLYAGKKGDGPTVKSLQPVWLDSIGPDGRPVPIAEHAQYDPLSDEYQGGAEPLDLDGHLSPSAI